MIDAILGIVGALVLTLALIALAVMLGKLAGKFSRYNDRH